MAVWHVHTFTHGHVAKLKRECGGSDVHKNTD